MVEETKDYGELIDLCVILSIDFIIIYGFMDFAVDSYQFL